MKKHKRRTFIQQTAALLSGSTLLLNKSWAINSLFMEKIVNIEPIGFQWKTYDPFLFCAYHNDKFPKGNENLGPHSDLLKGRNIGQDFSGNDGWSMYHGKTVPGFPVHPHRGFETITVVRKGLVDHSDSMQAAGRYGDGDVQWMTAGKGVQHAEMFPLIHSEKNNPLELFQIWLNLPKRSKMSDAFFKMFWKNDIPKIEKVTENKKVTIEVIAGELEEKTPPAPAPQSWAADKNNEVAVWNILMDKGSSLTLPKASKEVNRTIYLYEGASLTAADTTVPSMHMARLKPDEEITITASLSNCSVLVLQGKPLGEPVVQYGPFVMNTKQEIQDTYEEYQRTQFGGWPWESPAPTHGDKKRFAKYADGTTEFPE